MKSVCKRFRKIILESDFNRVKREYLESEKYPYLNAEHMFFGTIYPTYMGGRSHAEIHGLQIAA